MKVTAIKVVAGTLVRPADTAVYASGDLMGQNTIGASVVPLAFPAARRDNGSYSITRVRINKNNNVVASASFRLHLFSVKPTIAAGAGLGDNGVFATSVSGSANYIGYIDVTVDVSFVDGAFGATALTQPIRVTATGDQNIYGLLEARAAYTPASGETFTCTLETVQD